MNTRKPEPEIALANEDDVLRRMLGTPPSPHVEKKPPKKKPAKKPAK